MHGTTIRMLLEVKWEFRSLSSWHSDIGIPINFHEESGIITFWSIELCVPLEVSMDVRTLSWWGGHLGLSLDSPQGIYTSLFLVRWKTSLHSSHCRKSDLLYSHGISVSTLLEAANSGTLSHTYCWGKGTPEVLVESWPTSSIESWGPAVFSRWYGVHEAFLEFLCWNWCYSRFETGMSGNLCNCLR